MKAMIFAAGLGTRLRPLTNDRPKALVEVMGMSLLEIQLRRLRAFGVEQVVVNIHHFADLMEQRVEELRQRLEMDIVISDERGLLLETGGGLKKAEPLLVGNSPDTTSSDHATTAPDSTNLIPTAPIAGSDSPILIVNVDVISNIDYGQLLARFQESNSLAMLALRQRPTSRYLVWDEGLCLKGWVHKGTGEVRGLVRSVQEIEANHWQTLAFSGIHIISPELFGLICQEGKFSIIDTYLDLASTGRIHGFRHDDDIWLDVGKPMTLALAAKVFDQVLPQ